MTDENRLATYSLWKRVAILILLAGVLYAPFLNKPVHIDDANFLMLSEGAAVDWWRPHAIEINWSGVSEPAFDILSNPPGIAWYLLPVRHSPEWVMHLWMLPWLLIGAWGCHRLVKHFTEGDGFYETLYILTCPVVILSLHALTPDLPVFACMSAGVGGYLTSNKTRFAFAVLAGCAVLFRYSGGLAIPFLFFIGWLRGGWKEAFKTGVSSLPVILLAAHDLHAYGEIHLLTMFSNQNGSKELAVTVGNFLAGIAMLGGVGVLPILIWRIETTIGGILGACIGVSTALLYELSFSASVSTVIFLSCGMAALTLAFTKTTRDKALSTWAIGGALFFFVVRFGAARYWAAFIPGVALLAIRNVKNHRRWLITGVIANVLLSFLLAWDDQNHAVAYQQSASRVIKYGTGQFSGHWGWQHYLMQQGWKPLERKGDVEAMYARGTAASQQDPNANNKLLLIDRFSIDDDWWGPRMHAENAEASYHASTLMRFAPWTFSNEPYDAVFIYRRSSADE